MKHERILYEDNDIFVCHKPAGIATQTARVGQADMVSEITNYLKAFGSDLKNPSMWAWFIVWISQWRGFWFLQKTKRRRQI